MPKLLSQKTQISESSPYIDSSYESSPTSLLNDLNNLRYQLRLIIGSGNWSDAPATSLSDINSHYGGNSHIDWTSASDNFSTSGSGSFGTTLTVGTTSSFVGVATFESTGGIIVEKSATESFVSISGGELVLENLRAPVSNDDAATKIYVDNNIGTSGYSGYSGISGYSGTSGYSGELGSSGTSGYSGFSGLSGYSGLVGETGTSGYSGYSGSGISGYSGSGISGYSGDSGFSGGTGYSGYSGYSGGGDLLYFGSGDEGDTIINTNTSLVRDMYYNDLTITNTSILSPSGFRIFVRGILTIDSGSSISEDGGAGGNGGNGTVLTDPGAGGVPGTVAHSAGSLPAPLDGTSGGEGGNGGADPNGAGSNSGGFGSSHSQTDSLRGTSTGATGGTGGDGGKGSGDALGGTGLPGITGGSRTEIPATSGDMRDSVRATKWATISSAASVVVPKGCSSCGSAAGGAGGGSGPGAGSDGGAGGGGAGGGGNGGYIFIAANRILNSGSITANGGAGGNGGNGGDGEDFGSGNTAGGGGGAGAGSGGSGGVIVIISNTVSYGTVTVSGGLTGSAGSGGSGNVSGQNGEVGNTGSTGLIIGIVPG